MWLWQCGLAIVGHLIFICIGKNLSRQSHSCEGQDNKVTPKAVYPFSKQGPGDIILLENPCCFMSLDLLCWRVCISIQKHFFLGSLGTEKFWLLEIGAAELGEGKRKTWGCCNNGWVLKNSKPIMTLQFSQPTSGVIGFLEGSFNNKGKRDNSFPATSYFAFSIQLS